ncbi:MAG: hypothetical protein IKM51_05170, partial [Oscillospiraceae bacterium]|nr:hypothetical protein [Oscillospiraceae bacterium]
MTFSAITPRVQSIRQMYRTLPPTMDSERSRIVTEYYMAHNQQPPMLKRANVFYELLSKMTVRVEPDELIVGNLGKYYHNCLFAVEYDGATWLMDELRSETFDDRTEADGYAVMQQDDKDYFCSEAFVNFWKNNALSSYTDEYMPEGIEKVVAAGVLPHLPTGNCRSPHGHFNANYKKVLNKGFAAIKQEAQEALDSIYSSIDTADIEKIHFYSAVKIVCDAMIRFSERYAEECRRQAELADNDARKQELLTMADGLDWIMKNPARTYHEALQAIILYHFALSIDGSHLGLTVGRVDQMLCEFYERDIAEGILTKEKAQELMDCFFLKLTEICYAGSKVFNHFIGAYTSNQRLTLSGRKADGSDATNAVTYLCLESAARLKLHDPTLSLCIHSDTPKELIKLGIETNKIVGGIPTFENTDMIIDTLRKQGFTVEDARNFCIVGCVELSGSGCDFANISGPFSRSFINLNNVLLQAINNGVNPMNGVQSGKQTGTLAEMTSFQQVLNAFQTQFDFFMDWMHVLFKILEKAGNSQMPIPAASATIDGCLEKGMDMVYGGAKYNATGLSHHGIGTLVDSLCAIRYLVFDAKVCTGKELLDAVKANWEGYEDLRIQAENCPHRFGNADSVADELASWVSDMFTRRVKHMSGPRGKYRAGLYSAGGNLATGRGTWATPNGRRSREVVSDGASPTHGADVNGPISVLNSVLSLHPDQYGNGIQFCIRFHPSCFTREDGVDKFIAMLDSFFTQGGMQLQINILDSETLKCA